MVTVKNHLLESDFKDTIRYVHYYIKITGCCYHSVNGFRYGVVQSYPTVVSE